MKVYGDSNLAILNGGTAGWINAGLPFSTAAANGGGGTWTASKANMRYIASSRDVARSIGKKQIVDARPMPFYVGLVKKPNVGAAGHIKDAVNLPPNVRSTATGGSARYLTAADYREIFPHLGIKSGKPSITYCNTGHLASGAWFVLSEVMGNPNVKLYDGSMYEWTTEKRPVVGLR
jgi:thiosulfate/3-mercaptopyruvate sulfurtransferase